MAFDSEVSEVSVLGGEQGIDAGTERYHVSIDGVTGATKALKLTNLNLYV